MEGAPKLEKNTLRVASINEELISSKKTVETTTEIAAPVSVAQKTVSELKEEIEDLQHKIAFTKNYSVPYEHLYEKGAAPVSLEQELLDRQALLAEKTKKAPKSFFRKVRTFFTF